MSNVSNRHSVIPFVAGKTQPLNGQRLAKVGYKSTAKTPAKFKSVAVSVPKINDPLSIEQMEKMNKHMIAVLETAQDGIIKSLYESSQGALSSVSDEEISFDACLAFLEAEAQGGRLTKEGLEVWFTGNVEGNLTVAIAEKLGWNDPTQAQLEQIAKHVAAYKALIASLSGGATVLNVDQIKQVKKVFDLASEEDDTLNKLKKRIEKMEQPAPVAELISLD